MHRPAQRLTRILTCAAAVPMVVLSAAGCSLLSGSGGGDDGDSSSSPSSAASAAAPTYTKLPDPCHVLSKKTQDALVPEAESGKAAPSDDTSLRAGCSFNSLDSNGVKGSQFRWLDVSLARFGQDAGTAPDKAAEQYYEKQLSVARASEGATGVHTVPVSGTGGDQASAVAYDLKKKGGSFKQQTVVVRTHNAVVTVDYDGAGLAGEKSPDPTELMKDAQQAAKEAVAAIASGNGAGGGSSSPSESSSSSSSSASS